MTITCLEMLEQKWRDRKHVCVGLDPLLSEMPGHFSEGYGGDGPKIKSFVCDIVYQTRDVAGAYKANLWFYLAEGLQGLWALQEIARFAKCTAPDVPFGLDMKAGDIGSTMKQAARFAFEKLGVDFATVNPWGGREDSIDAFLEYKDKMIFTWCRGSNSGADDIQDMDRLYNKYHSSKVYESVAIKIGPLSRDSWNYNNNCGTVVGATKDCTGEIAIREVRRYTSSMPMLIPGTGKQRGDLAKAVGAAIYVEPTSHKKTLPALINSSRDIIYASDGRDCAEAARGKTIELNDNILAILKERGLDEA